MLKCPMCPAEFDDLKEIPYPKHDDNQIKKEVNRELAAQAQRDHSAKQNEWRQFRVLFDNGDGGEDHVLVGHACPDCRGKLSSARLTAFADSSKGGAL